MSADNDSGTKYFHCDSKGNCHEKHPCHDPCEDHHFPPIIPPINPVQAGGLQIQLQSAATTTVTPGGPVLFDTIVSSQSSFISYNTLTGVVTLTRPGLYYINWWVTIAGVSGADLPTFAIVTSTGATIRASSLSIGQITGNALIRVTSSPVTLQLVNFTTDTITLATLPVKADLTIITVG